MTTPVLPADPSCTDELANNSVELDQFTQDAHRKSRIQPSDNISLQVVSKPIIKPRISRTDKRWFGLVLHNVAIGVVSTTLPLTIYPFLNNYLNMEGTQTLSARALLSMPCVLKPILELLGGSVPWICSKRRLMLVLGWLICGGALSSIYWIPIPSPYYQDRRFVGVPLVQLSASQLESITKNAPLHGGTYTMLMSIASVGFIIADFASDSILNDLRDASEKNPAQDSVFISTISNHRHIAMMCTFLFMAIGMSGFDYGGTFPFTVDYNTLMLMMGLISFVPIPFCIWMVLEVEGSSKKYCSLREKCQELSILFQNSIVNHVLVCRFLGGVFAGISATAVNPIAFYWANVQPMNDNVVAFVMIGLVFCLLHYADKKGWKLNHRNLIIYSTVVALFADFVCTMCAIWNVIRSQMFWIGLPVLEAIPSALDFIIFNVLWKEIAEPSAGPTIRSLVGTVAFIASPIGLAVTKYIDGPFDITNHDLMLDTSKVRLHATITFMIAYAAQSAALMWIWVLPRYKTVPHDQKRRSCTHKVKAVVLTSALVLCFGWCVATHVLSVNNTTMCMVLAGGTGC